MEEKNREKKTSGFFGNGSEKVALFLTLIVFIWNFISATGNTTQNIFSAIGGAIVPLIIFLTIAKIYDKAINKKK